MAVSVRILIFFIGIFPVFHSVSEEYPYEMQQMNAEQAFEVGRLLRAQFKNLAARNYLKYAADLGESNAAYLYAMEVANYRTTIRTPPESQQYLLKAAQNGNRQAMRELYINGHWLRDVERRLWQQRYYNAVIELGAVKSSQAAYELALFYQTSDPKRAEFYLDVAVDFTHPGALMLKAKQISQGKGRYPIPGSRETEMRKTYLQAAQTGYIPAIRNYIQLLEHQRKYQDAYYWRQQAVQHGDLISLVVMGNILSGQSESYRFIEPNLEQAQNYIGLYLDVAGYDRLRKIYKNSQNQMVDISMKLNESQGEFSSKIDFQFDNNQIFFNHDDYWDNW